MAGLKGITINTSAEEKAHINAEDDAAIYQTLFGTDGVSTIGSQCEATVLSNNSVRIADGVICVGGHFARIPYGDYADVDIANGKSGKKRNDIICARFSTSGSGGIDTMKIIVKQGTEGDTAVDPGITQDNLYGGGKTRDYALYRVRIEGLSIAKVEKMFTVVKTGKEMLKEITTLKQNMESRCVTRCGTKVVTIPANSDSVQVLTEEEVGKILGVSDATSANTSICFSNGDGAAMSLHVEGTTYLKASWWAVLSALVKGETQCRINYIIAYGGTQSSSSAGGTSGAISAQSKTVTPTIDGQTVFPDEGYDYLKSVTLEKFPYKEDTVSGSTTVQIG